MDWEALRSMAWQLFPDILPIALCDWRYLLSTRTQRGSRSLKEFRKWDASIQPLKKLNALGHLSPHRLLLNNTIEHPALILQVNKTPRNVFPFPFWHHQEAHKKEMEQLAKTQSAEWISNYFVPLISNLLTVFALTLAPCSWLIIGARKRPGTGRTQHRLAIFPGGNMSRLITFIITSTSNANGETEKNSKELHWRTWESGPFGSFEWFASFVQLNKVKANNNQIDIKACWWVFIACMS